MSGTDRDLNEARPAHPVSATATRDRQSSLAAAEGLVPSPPAASQGADVRAYIDLGTNSIRLVLVQFHTKGTYTVLSEQKETVRLGEDEFRDGNLRRAAMARAVLVCRRFSEMATALGATSVNAIATSATREAHNRDRFLRQLRRDAGLDVRTISGLEEARLIYAGVSSGLDLGADRAVFIDVGGGSTEVVVGGSDGYEHLDSLKLGAIRLATLFSAPDDERVGPEAYGLIKRYAYNKSVRPLQRITQRMPVDRAIGSSGTIENLADIAIRRFEQRPRRRDDTLGYEQLCEVMAELGPMTVEERRRVPGINRSRADIIVPGGAIVEVLMESLGIEQLEISDRGLRDGLIQDDLQRQFPGLGGLAVRDRSVLELARRCRIDERHAATAKRLACSLFDQTRELGLHKLDDDAREILGHAATLHDVGAFLSYSHHHVHTYYIVRHSDLLGFDQTEIALLAATARFHRKGYPRKRHAEFVELPKSGRKAVRYLAACLRLAEALDRGHAAVVQDVRLTVPEDGVARLEVTCNGPCDLELWGAQAQGKAFRKAFGVALTVEQATDDGSRRTETS